MDIFISIKLTFQCVMFYLGCTNAIERK
ncbi:hypothetical protein BCEP4_140003 [Burkholderia cepacia]|nr:hypothetical protein BCEP4_140003 [Burkholderia cepacia]